ncbi:MAG: gamma-glutamylcyclotransferase family protein [Solirubrobacterales bacterium]
MPNTGTIEAIERAKTYPFRQPVCSYIFTHDHEHLLEGDPDGWQVDVTDLTPVFGYGSNPSPVALAHKFASVPEVRIPVISFELDGFDAVYSSHVSSGYVPATLAPSPGTTFHGFITYLTDEEMAIMDRSESRGENYELRPIASATGHFEDGTFQEGIQTYVSLHGTIELDGQPVAVEGTRASGRSFPVLSQAEMMARAIDVFAPGTDSDLAIGRLLASRDQQRAWTASLKNSGLSRVPVL